MDELRKLYAQLTGDSSAPALMALGSKDEPIVRQHLMNHFTHVGTTPPGSLTIDEFLEFQRTMQGLEGHVLVRWHDRSGENAFYFEVRNVDPALAQDALRRMTEGSELYVHITGTNWQKLAEQLAPYLKPVEGHVRAEEVSDGQVYRRGYTYFVNATIINRDGLHLRAAAEIVRKAGSYDKATTIEIARPDKNIHVNAKSIMGVLTLVAEKGTKLVTSAKGPDAEQAVKGLYATIQGIRNLE